MFQSPALGDARHSKRIFRFLAASLIFGMGLSLFPQIGFDTPITSAAPRRTNIIIEPPTTGPSPIALTPSNGDFEQSQGTPATPVSWSQGQWGSLTANFTYPVTGQNGYGAQVSVTNWANGDAKWVFDRIPVSAGQTWSYTDYYKATVPTDITAEFDMGGGYYQYLWLGSAPANASWTPFSGQITVPSGATQMTIFHVISQNGTLSIDTVRVTTATPIPSYTVTVTKSGDGSGTVTGNGISCGTDCTETVLQGTSMTLTATASAGSTFAGWSGPCGGTGACTFTVSGPVDVTATFHQITPPDPSELPLNGNFETASANPSIPLGWQANSWGTINAAFSYPVTGEQGYGARVTVSSRSSGDAKWTFDSIPVSAGQTWTYRNRYQATVPTNVSIEYRMSDGSYQYGWLGDAPASASWTTFEGQVTIIPNAVAVTVFQALVSTGTLTIDTVSMTQGGGATEFPHAMITLAFDDGWESIYQNGRPILNAAGIPSTQYIVTGIVGWDGYMTWDQIATLASEGHEIAAHTRTHTSLTTLTPTQAWNEIRGSYDDLVAHGHTPLTFTYPYGEFNAAIKQQVRDAGFIGARSVFEGYNSPNSDRYELRDQHIESNVKIQKVQTWINEAIANNQWLILEFHQQLKGAGQYSNTPARLQSIVNAIQSSGIEAVTLAEGISRMGQ